MKTLPKHLYKAHQWISAAGEWNEAINDRAAYAHDAALLAIYNEQYGVLESDLLEVIDWHKGRDTASR